MCVYISGCKVFAFQIISLAHDVVHIYIYIYMYVNIGIESEFESKHQDSGLRGAKIEQNYIRKFCLL